MSCNEWREVKLGDVLNFKRGYDLPKSKMINGEYPVIGSNGIIGFHNEYTTKAPCVTVGRSGNIGTPHILNQDCWAHNTTLFIDNFKGNDAKFLYYLLKTLNLSHYGGGSAVPTLNRNHIHQINILFPNSKNEQKAIAKILSDLDEKIEINNKINKVLEEMAQAIFKRWFVDFEFPNENGEPYKSSGGEMVESELGLIPKGWEVGRLGEIIEICSGKRPKEKTNCCIGEYKIPLVGASKIMGFTKEYLYNQRVLVIGRVGTHGIIQKFNEAIWPSDNTLVINTEYYDYVYNILKNIDYISLNRGSTQPLITQTDIKNILIILPEKELLKKYEKIIKKYTSMIEHLQKENILLENNRDTLLPKLMSGEIRVPLD